MATWLQAAVLLILLTVPQGLAFRQFRTTIDLNGIWAFDQTEAAFPPAAFTRTIPVPGLISLADPPIKQYDRLFVRPDSVTYNSGHNVLETLYEPRYNWYRRQVVIPEELRDSHAVLTVLKSKYVTQVIVNGIDVGTSTACYTPVEFPVTNALRFGQENEILIRVGDRSWLPSQAAGSTDKEKINYIPGIWDDVSLSFTGDVRVHRALFLPSYEQQSVTAKLQLRSFHPPQLHYGDAMEDPVVVAIVICEKGPGGKKVAELEAEVVAKRDNVTIVSFELPLQSVRPWSPDDPFLYTGEVTLREGGAISDHYAVNFGVRDFRRMGRHFALNGKRFVARGSNITLHRFFEDPDCRALPWDREWVSKLLIEIPKAVHWNMVRVCVGIAPRLWYEIADEYGLLIQNEWLYWQNHGWDDQIRAEYLDWVWTDGNHPSIVIWDAINENWDDYIGNTLIPELKQVDPTRIWDAGYMTSAQMVLDEMDEPHPYCVYGMDSDLETSLLRDPYPLGDLHYCPERFRKVLESSAAQLVNEYGWMWLWRDGRPSKLMQYSLPFYLGQDSTTEQRRFFQAYWEQLQTEWLRAERSLAGVLSFCYLTNNYGYTGDWFLNDVRDLEPGSTLDWYRHAFSPAAVFIDLTDERFTRHLTPRTPGGPLHFNLVGVNDQDYPVTGSVDLSLFDETGHKIKRGAYEITTPPYWKSYLPVEITLPEKPGGYLLLAEFWPRSRPTEGPVLSRRYIKVGNLGSYAYFDLDAENIR